MAKRHIWGDVLCCPSGPSFPIILRMLFAILLHCISCFPLPGRLLCSFPLQFTEKILHWFPEKDTYMGSTFGNFTSLQMTLFYPQISVIVYQDIECHTGDNFPSILKELLLCFLAPSSAVVKFKSITESDPLHGELTCLLWTLLKSSLCSHCFGKYFLNYWILFFSLFSLFVCIVFEYFTSRLVI